MNLTFCEASDPRVFLVAQLQSLHLSSTVIPSLGLGVLCLQKTILFKINKQTKRTPYMTKISKQRHMSCSKHQDFNTSFFFFLLERGAQFSPPQMGTP